MHVCACHLNLVVMATLWPSLLTVVHIISDKLACLDKTCFRYNGAVCVRVWDAIYDRPRLDYLCIVHLCQWRIEVGEGNWPPCFFLLFLLPCSYPFPKIQPEGKGALWTPSSWVQAPLSCDLNLFSLLNIMSRLPRFIVCFWWQLLSISIVVVVACNFLT